MSSDLRRLNEHYRELTGNDAFLYIEAPTPTTERYVFAGAVRVHVAKESAKAYLEAVIAKAEAALAAGKTPGQAHAYAVDVEWTPLHEPEPRRKPWMDGAIG